MKCHVVSKKDLSLRAIAWQSRCMHGVYASDEIASSFLLATTNFSLSQVSDINLLYNCNYQRFSIYEMLSEIGPLIIAAFFAYAIYKGLNAIFSTFPESSFREFILSASGNVLTGFISIIILFMAFVFFMVNISGIHC
jgi:hypothetical protein